MGSGGCPTCSLGEKKNRGSFEESAAPGPIFSPAASMSLPEPQTPSSALRGRQGIHNIEQRMAKALRVLSGRLKCWVFIAAKE